MMEYAPSILKGEKKSVFDLLYEALPAVSVDFDAPYMMEARKILWDCWWSEKEKIIKSTLELVIQTTSSKIISIAKVDAEDWFTVSKVINHYEAGELGVFSVGEDNFKILKAQKCKCPRCWKYRAKSEEDLCHRCKESAQCFDLSV